MQHGPEFFSEKWGSSTGSRYTDEWGSTTSKEKAVGIALSWKVNDQTSVEVQAVGEVVHCIQYTHHSAADSFWTADQVSRALEANGSGWTDATRVGLVGPLANSLASKYVIPRQFVSVEGNQAEAAMNQLKIRSNARVQAERAAQARQVAEQAAKAEAERKTRY